MALVVIQKTTDDELNIVCSLTHENCNLQIVRWFT